MRRQSFQSNLGSLTHEPSGCRLAEPASTFRHGIAPLIQAGQGLVFFGNHVRAQAVRNTLTLTGFLKEYGLGLGRA